MSDPGAPTRRDFLAAAAVGLVACARGSQGVAHSEGPHPDDALLYVGTYTEGTRSEGIYLLRLDQRSGKLRRVGSVDGGANPSFLAIHPNGRVLYAVNEVETQNGIATGGVSAFTIATGTGALTRMNEQISGGGAPCYVSADRSGRVVLVANYMGGSVAVLPIESDGSLAPAAQVVKHTGAGPDAERQEAPHAHCIVTDPSSRYVLVVDLGTDRVYVYRLDIGAESLRRVEGGDGVMRAGAGPRHIAFHPTLPLAYVANELDSTVSTLGFDAERGALRSSTSGRHCHPGGPAELPATSTSHHPAAHCTCRTVATIVLPCSRWRNRACPHSTGWFLRKATGRAISASIRAAGGCWSPISGLTPSLCSAAMRRAGG